MMRVLTWTGLLVALLAMSSMFSGVNAAPPDQPAGPTADEQAIRNTVAQFVAAFNAGDAHRIAALFTRQAEIVDEAGQATRGREEIERVFADQFRAQPGAKIDIQIGSIRLLGENAAIEEGVSTVMAADGAPPTPSRYTVNYVKQDGVWLMTSARDEADDESIATSELEALAWLVGDWVDESAAGTVKTTYRWTDNHKFLVGEFRMQVSGQPIMSGSQRIGWDPLAKQIRSWVFDSDGGFSEALWTQAGEQWIVKTSGVTRRGQAGSATNIYRQISRDRFSFESRDRTIGNQVLPHTGPLTVVRQAPPPKKQ